MSLENNGRGSPPQMRGKYVSSLPLPLSSRVTPANAGKIGHTVGRLFRFQGHPRKCGENRCSCPLAVAMRGSPPQVRGKY